MIDFFQHIYFSLRDILAGTYTLRILVNFFQLLFVILPYFFIAVLIQVVLFRVVQRRKFTLSIKNEHLAIVMAAVLGVLSPMPTYAAVPIALSLVHSGLAFSAAMTFMIASPLINPSVFFLTASLLGLKLAVLRVVASLLIAIAGGYLIKAFSVSPHLNKNISGRTSEPRPFFVDFYRTTLFLGKYFLVALLLSAAVKALVPAEAISRLFGRHVSAGLVAAIALGVPFYSCGGAAIPFIQVLMERGMSTAAALAFFIAGPATKLETLYIYKSLLGYKILIFYLILTGLGAYLVGIAVHFIF
jgi:uncharacterized membrane protein YraQ (UPF0718 family)